MSRITARTLLKVTGPNGEPINGGTGVWSLPAGDTAGFTTPGGHRRIDSHSVARTLLDEMADEIDRLTGVLDAVTAVYDRLDATKHIVARAFAAEFRDALAVGRPTGDETPR